MSRRKKSSPIILIVLVVIVAVFAWFLIPRQEKPYPRETFVVAGDPLMVLSWNPRDRTLVTISMPESLEAEGTHGYGVYSFAAFWRLGEIDKKDGTVLSESVSEALGIPVDGYIGAKKGQLGDNVFTLQNSFAYIRGMYRTNISFWTFIRLAWLLQVTKPATIERFDFTRNPGLIAQDVTIADGSHELLVAPDSVDVRLAHVFEDERIRRETVTAVVYNTTDIPSLGNRVARLLGNLGVSVVAVANDSPQVSVCTVSGTALSLESASANVIASVLGCTKHSVSQSERADLTVRIGSVWAKRFVPN